VVVEWAVVGTGCSAGSDIVAAVVIEGAKEAKMRARQKGKKEEGKS
jgi:hypothetical protein